MKAIFNFFLATLLIISISACEHNVSMETTVHEDGTIDKIITLETGDTVKNFLGIGPATGWKLTASRMEDSTQEKVKDEKKWKSKFEKTFASAQQANEELASPSDSLFRISSKFEKQFKWFYTHLYYSDTYHSINRMSYPSDDYFTPEDFAFIDRLPAEGEIISKADSLYLSRLHDKIFDVYGLRAIYEEHYQLSQTLISESGVESQWLDTLKRHKENLFRHLADKKDVPEDFMFKAIDSLIIPFPTDKMRSRYDELYALEDAKTSFINHASEGKYTHVINMPWSIVNSNADSVAGNQLRWSPPSIKFLLKDYTMYAEARRVNYWAVALSVLLVIFTIYLFVRKK
jgi:hypothetical protein